MAKSSGGISSGSSGAAYSSGRGSSGMGQASSAPIGGLGQVPGTSMYSLGGVMGGSPTYGGGYIGSVGDSRTFSALSPRSQAYMQQGSPGSYASWLQGGAGGGGGAPGGGASQGSGGAVGTPSSLQNILAMLFAQHQPQQRPDYSQLFMGSGVNLESPMTMVSQAPQQLGGNYNTFSNRPAYSFGNINPYGA